VTLAPARGTLTQKFYAVETKPLLFRPGLGLKERLTAS
jgi:hypothetical protein